MYILCYNVCGFVSIIVNQPGVAYYVDIIEIIAEEKIVWERKL